MASKFSEHAAKLTELHKLFRDSKLSSVEFANLRETELGKALLALAKEHGVALEQPLQCDSNGEFSIVALNPNGTPTNMGAGPFGKEFADLLNQYSPRTGVRPGATLDERNGWCRMNHFEVEKMILDRLEAQTTQSHADGAHPTPGAASAPGFPSPRQ